MAKLKLYVVAFYEDVKVKSALLHIDGCQGAFIEIDEESLPYIQFFSSKKAAQKVCDEWNNECEDGEEEAVVEEYIFNVKQPRKKK